MTNIKFFITTSLLTLSALSYSQERNNINVPDLDSLITLKCDFHIHTVFSDGLVWPTVRVQEAYSEGLDAISITEHIEYRPHKKDVVSDHNRSFDIAQKTADEYGVILIKGSEITRPMAPGHSNAIFIKDSNSLDKKKYMDAYKEAKKQNAFIFWNHPGWYSQQPDTTLWWPEHSELLEKGMMHGIEVANGVLLTPEAIDWCLENKLTMLGSSDIHQPINTDVDFAKGEHRSMTFVLAKERSEQGIREAFEARRTLVYYQDMLIGEEQYLRPFFEKSIEISEVSRDEKSILIRIENKTDLEFKFNKTDHDVSLEYFRDYHIKPNSRHDIRIRLKNGITGGDMNFDVTNLWIGNNKPLPFTIKL